MAPRCIFGCMSVPYLAAICFRPSYSDLEMETSGLVGISSRFSKVDQTTRSHLEHSVMHRQL